MADIPIYPILKDLSKGDFWVRGGEPDNDRWMSCRCPFHGDRQASASINRTGFNCHACGVQGDALSILMDQEGLDFAGAVARAAEILGVSETEVSGIPDSGKRRRAILDDDPGPVVGQRQLFQTRRRRRPVAGS